MALFLLVVCLLLSLALIWRLDWLPLRSSSSPGRAKRSRLHRLLKPRCPDDCPACRLASPASSAKVPADVASLVRGEKPTGSPPLESTPRASLVRTRSARTSATPMLSSTRLFGDGKHGRAEPIQTFRGPACRTPFSARRDTPLYRLKTPPRAGSPRCSLRLSEGLDPSAAARVAGLPTGHHHWPF